MTMTSLSPTAGEFTPPIEGRYDGTVAAADALISANFPSIANAASHRVREPLFILLLAIAGFLVMGYHPGLEDDGIYLSAVKADLNSSLYPHDLDFFRLQTQATVFDHAMAAFVRVTRIPVEWSEMLWQFLSLYVILFAAHRIAQKLFTEPHAAWAAVALLSAMFTLPVAGTALNIADQHLHPRNVATALILCAVERVLASRRMQAAGLLAGALLVHPIMAAFGISFCVILACVSRNASQQEVMARIRSGSIKQFALAAVPMAWIFETPTVSWRRALSTRSYYFLSRWTWYEWLGVIAPLVLFYLLWRWERSHPTRSKGAASKPALKTLALALLLYGIFQQVVAFVMLGPAALVRLTPLQPMRYLHLEYALLVLIGGGMLGKHCVGISRARWLIFLLAAGGTMFAFQRLLLPASEHIEWPGRPTANEWLRAFSWIRQNTPQDAYFALDPKYMELPREDFHSFRALAERSQLADEIKDAAVATQVPELASRWAQEVDAQAGWDRFRQDDFQALNARFGVDWLLLSEPPPARLTCIWHEKNLSVCRIPGVRRIAVP
jgi:hypothetical protein